MNIKGKISFFLSMLANALNNIAQGLQASADITEMEQMDDAAISHSKGLDERTNERTAELERFGFQLQKLYEISFAPAPNVKEFARSIIKEVARMLDVDGAAIGRVNRDEGEGGA